MELAFADFNELRDMPISIATECTCGHYKEMVLETCNVNVGEDYHIRIDECPIMKCTYCGQRTLCPDVKGQLVKIHQRLEQNRQNEYKGTTRGSIKFKYCESASFKYDSRDLFIPGLNVDCDPTRFDGFSCPVFFDRKVLNVFLTDDDYTLEFASESYGTIGKKGGDGWALDWCFYFGINRNDHVVAFLGDLDDIDSSDRAIHFLKAYNIESDHCLVDSDFYQAQYNCTFCDPTKEKLIYNLRTAFFDRIKRQYGIELYHLEEEAESKISRIHVPIDYSEHELEGNITVLNGIFNEAICVNSLRELYKKTFQSPPAPDIESKTRKLLEKIIAQKLNEQKAKTLMSALYCLADLRVIFDHLISAQESQRLKNNVITTFELTCFNDYRTLYNTLLNRLYNLYKTLNALDI